MVSHNLLTDNCPSASKKKFSWAGVVGCGFVFFLTKLIMQLRAFIHVSRLMDLVLVGFNLNLTD